MFYTEWTYLEIRKKWNYICARTTKIKFSVTLEKGGNKKIRIQTILEHAYKKNPQKIPFSKFKTYLKLREMDIEI